MIRRSIMIWAICMAIFILLLSGLLPRSADRVLAGFTPTPTPEPTSPPPPPVPPEEEPGKPEKTPAPPPPLQLPTVAPSEPSPILPETGESRSPLLPFRSLWLLFLGSGMIALAVWVRRR